jgi:RNA exonuclease 1
MFPHPKGLPYRYSLKYISEAYLRRLIQQNQKGHDSQEDALACLDLVQYKINQPHSILYIRIYYYY